MIEYITAAILYLCAGACDEYLGPDPQEGAKEVAEALADAATSHDLPPLLLVAMARHESYFDQTAVSTVGAFGILQVMPAHWGRSALKRCLQDPGHCVWWQSWAGARAMAHYRRKCGGVRRALYAYRSGRCGPPRKDYEVPVLVLWQRLQRGYREYRPSHQLAPAVESYFEEM